eukprot:TRINITY_DN2649_c0_g1_i12.p3 TRINITY_DN2649_c0_g1~~TRINITY_DN2649_c0_g1_i12.p3  ORF type:complete len:185 (-),score=-13.26 TRINITY_DN2649_c0_g1_i12:274-828(-)
MVVNSKQTLPDLNKNFKNPNQTLFTLILCQTLCYPQKQHKIEQTQRPNKLLFITSVTILQKIMEKTSKFTTKRFYFIIIFITFTKKKLTTSIALQKKLVICLITDTDNRYRYRKTLPESLSRMSLVRANMGKFWLKILIQRHKIQKQTETYKKYKIELSSIHFRKQFPIIIISKSLKFYIIHKQ